MGISDKARTASVLNSTSPPDVRRVKFPLQANILINSEGERLHNRGC